LRSLSLDCESVLIEYQVGLRPRVGGRLFSSVHRDVSPVAAFLGAMEARRENGLP
jgi:hypothetical protein